MTNHCDLKLCMSTYENKIYDDLLTKKLNKIAENKHLTQKLELYIENASVVECSDSLIGRAKDGSVLSQNNIKLKEILLTLIVVSNKIQHKSETSQRNLNRYFKNIDYNTAKNLLPLIIDYNCYISNEIIKQVVYKALEINDNQFYSISSLNPLHIAVKQNDINSILLLIKIGFNIDEQNREKYTPLLLAVKENNFEMVQVLIKEGANTSIPYSQDEEKYKPLLLAAKEGNQELVQLYSDASDDHTMLFSNDSTIMHLAAQNGNVKIIQFLCEKVQFLPEINTVILHCTLPYNQTN